MRSHQELIDGLTASALSESQQSTHGDEQQALMSAAGPGFAPGCAEALMQYPHCYISFIITNVAIYS